MISRLLRLFGYRIVPARGHARHWRNLAAMLKKRRIDVVFDVGANTGQYVGYLRNGGFDGRIVSFEPLASAHATLVRKAERDPAWTVAPRMALGADAGTATLHVSNEDDMSSLLRITGRALETSPTSRTIADEDVPLSTLADIFEAYARPGERVFVKVDTQGYEKPVMLGAEAVMDRIEGWQLEMSIVEIYEGEPDWHDMMEFVEALGYQLYFVIGGYYNRHIGRMMQFDGVFMRPESESA